MLSNILDKSFEEAAELIYILVACKKIYKNHRLSTSLKSPYTIHCNSNYIMLKSIGDSWFTVTEVLSEKGENQRVIFINYGTLKVLIELC